MTFPRFLIGSAQCLIKDKKSLIQSISHGGWYCHHIHYCCPAIRGFKESCPRLTREEKWGPSLWMSPESSKHLCRYKLRSRQDTSLDLMLLLRNPSWAIPRGSSHRKVPRILGSARAGLFKSQLPVSLLPPAWDLSADGPQLPCGAPSWLATPWSKRASSDPWDTTEHNFFIIRQTSAGNNSRTSHNPPSQLWGPRQASSFHRGALGGSMPARCVTQAGPQA